MTIRESRALLAAVRTHPKLVRDAMDKMVADYRKPGPSIVDLFTRPTPEGDGFYVESVYPAKSKRARWDR